MYIVSEQWMRLSEMLLRAILAKNHHFRQIWQPAMHNLNSSAGQIESCVPSIFGFTFLLAYKSRLQPLSINNIIIEFYYLKYTYIH